MKEKKGKTSFATSDFLACKIIILVEFVKLINRLFYFSFCCSEKLFTHKSQLEFWEYNTHAFEIEYTLSCHGQGQKPLEIVRH